MILEITESVTQLLDVTIAHVYSFQPLVEKTLVLGTFGLF